MPFIIPTFQEVRDALLRDIKNQLPSANTGTDSDYFIRASAVASAVQGIYQYQGWIVRQIFPDTADTEYLEWHARLRDIIRKPATYASGTVTLTGEPGSSAEAGLSISRDSLSIVTTSTATIGNNGKITCPAQSTIAGSVGNTLVEMSGMLTTTPAGFDSKVMIGLLSGGTARESDAALLARLLDIIRRPPAGGNKYDYKRWALEVPGVTDAFVFPLRRGLGTVDTVIISDIGLPSQEIINAAQAHIDDVRPVTAKHSLVLAPSLKVLDLHIKVAVAAGTVWVAIEAAVKAAVKDYIDRLSPGESFIRSKVETMVSLVDGVTDRQLVSPSTNIAPIVNANVVEWIRCGRIEVSPL
ncbi:baseplate J/gp47 family protein [Serratia liquefaciens]|uniref:baseplate J/gp47 family protein n=1 Tax=Serratia liquefaciens TaxID=614 RepID=UPI001F359B9A|nr:baseplate J/gp47 family protein [Serratia liquefaciens]MCE9939972.1 baseplate J/gp47 family protein [Serratia liquefaciens]